MKHGWEKIADKNHFFYLCESVASSKCKKFSPLPD
jgi:hypothetical protein